MIFPVIVNNFRSLLGTAKMTGYANIQIRYIITSYVFRQIQGASSAQI